MVFEKTVKLIYEHSLYWFEKEQKTMHIKEKCPACGGELYIRRT